MPVSRVHRSPLRSGKSSARSVSWRSRPGLEPQDLASRLVHHEPGEPVDARIEVAVDEALRQPHLGESRTIAPMAAEVNCGSKVGSAKPCRCSRAIERATTSRISRWRSRRAALTSCLEESLLLEHLLRRLDEARPGLAGALAGTGPARPAVLDRCTDDTQTPPAARPCGRCPSSAFRAPGSVCAPAGPRQDSNLRPRH